MKKALATLASASTAILLGLFVLDRFTCVEIENESFKAFVWIGVLVAAPMALVLAAFFLQGARKWIAVPAAAFLLYFAYLGPLAYFCRMSPWKTQTILYAHGHFRFLRIEHQMQDLGAFGYDQRTVRVLSLARILEIHASVDTTEIHSPEWIGSGEYVNEMNLR